MKKSTLTQGDPCRDQPSANNPRNAPLREPATRPLMKPTHLAPAQSNVDKED
jgi:hypothetical protein